MNFKRGALVLALSLPALFANAQGKASAPESWFTKDPTVDKVQGTGSDEALRKLKAKGKKSHTIIVAVLDSGVDFKHEDLKDVMWVNPGEIPNNGKDDDNNGYVDDIHGWNFIGGKDGKNVDHDTYELTREYTRLSKKYAGNSAAAMKDAYYKRVKEDFEAKKTEAEEAVKEIGAQFVKAEEAFAMVEKATGKKNLTEEDVAKINPGTNNELKDALEIVKKVLAQGITSDKIAEIKAEATEHFANELKYGLNPDYNPRTIVGDNYEDLTNRHYGNNDYRGPDASHGTHVAGIIAASRDNGKGINGEADNVRIMTVRCVPDGDERDKDVANAIRYAVDNGASVINMSFGKAYSPHKDYVDEAVKYAAAHDVLLVHAAGNSAANNDSDPNFPNDTYGKKGLFKPKTAPTWTEIGALSWKSGERRIASFSNYGKKGVDFFSPGKDVYSTIPDNKYAAFDGTSMASPAAAGVAAIIRSYYPDLSAKQVKSILLNSTVKQDGEVYKPGSTDKVKFSDICVTGGIVSASNAVDLADKTKPQRNKKATWQMAGEKAGKGKVAIP